MLARLSAILAACAGPALAHAADPAPVAHNFKLIFTVEMTMESGGRTNTISGGADFQYAWKCVGKERTLTLTEMSDKTKVGDKDLNDLKMSKAGMFGTENGKKVNRKYDDLPEPAQKMLRDTFDTPLCKLEVDEKGKEVKRTILAGPGAQIVIESGMITNTMLLHPPYYTDKDEWEAEGAVSAGHGEAKGKLAYKKIAGGKGGQLVKVSGTLDAKGVEDDGPLKAKEGKYVVTGTQTYDPDRKEWIASKLDVDVSVELTDGKKIALSMKGKMKIACELVPEKK